MNYQILAQHKKFSRTTFKCLETQDRKLDLSYRVFPENGYSKYLCSVGYIDSVFLKEF